jgi:fibro-slime domain-containing protein
MAKTSTVFKKDYIEGPDCSKPVVTATATTNTSSASTTPPNSITLEGIVRDFSGYGTTKHPDFERTQTELGGYAVRKDCVQKDLGSDGKPLDNPANDNCKISKLGDWYNGTDPTKTTTYSVTLTKDASGLYTFDSKQLPGASNGGFFPIDDKLLKNEGQNHNFHFTYEVHTKFTYQKGQTFSFTGDDDVWIFINNKLAVDIGGVHGASSASVNLDTLGLTVGQTYPLDGFFAERHTTESNFKMQTNLPLVVVEEKVGPDVWAHDPAPDQGVEPNTVSPTLWISPDVWVRNQNDGVNKHQNVKVGQDNFVNVNVANRGALPAKDTTVEVYRMNKGAGLGNAWPKGWDLVGTAKVTELAPGASQRVVVTWPSSTIPKPGHYCFYVRLINADDPIKANADTTNALQNTRNSNNIVWRNFDVVGLLTQVTSKFEVMAQNSKPTAAKVNIAITEPEKMLPNKGAKVVVDLGPLYSRWVSEGAKGNNIKALGGTEVELLTSDAKIIGIPMNADEEVQISVRVDATEPMPVAGTSKEYHFSMQEEVDGELAGGVDFLVQARALDTDSDGDGIKDVNDEDNDNDGIPDTWEVENDLNPLDATDASADADQDGASNLVEYQNKTNPRLATSVPRVDVWVSDPTPDQGVEPNTVSKDIWVSPDIWLRNQNDGSLQHQNVKQGQDNFVSVRVKNRGNLAAKNTKVEVYYIKASLGRAWPKDWTLVGTTMVDDLAPAGQKMVVIPWTKEKVPGPGHYCFYVRLLNDADPMTFKEINNAEQNTRNNNNIAWRNFDIVGLLNQVSSKFAVTVQNSKTTPAKIDLVIDEPEKMLDNKGARAIIDLGPLFDRWQAAGGKGENVKAIGGTEVELLTTTAKILGIPMQPEEELPIDVRVEALQPMPVAGVSHEYHFSMQELEDGEVAGGVDFIVETRALDTDSDGDGIKDVNDDDNDNDSIPDAWEIENGLNPLDATDATEDADKDGASNLVEYQNKTNPRLATSVPRVDVWVSDPTPDQGVEPNTVSKDIWVSPDVWLRNQNDGSLQHQNVKQGQDNFVSVRVRNRGNMAAKNTKVEVYYIKASLGRAWPKDWTLVGTAMVDDLAPAGQKMVVIPWTKDKVPGPGHYCFYVRLLNDADPMTFPEGRNSEQNTRNNNNIAWRNFDIVGLLNKVTDKFVVTVQNPNTKPSPINLVFKEPEGFVKQDGAKVRVDLGDLFKRWQDAGGQGENVKVVEGTTQVELSDTPATIIGIPMDSEEELPIMMEVEATQPVPVEGESHEYHFSIQEVVDNEVIGGVDTTIVARALDTDSDGDGIKDVEDEDNDNDGIPDAWEIEHGLNPLDNVDAEETGPTGNSNLEEYQRSLNSDDNTGNQGGGGTPEETSPWAASFTGGFYNVDTSVCSYLPKAVQDKNGKLTGWAMPQWIPIKGWLETANANGDKTGDLKVKVSSLENAKFCPAGAMTTGSCTPEEATSEQEFTTDASGKVDFIVMAWWPGVSNETITKGKAATTAEEIQQYRVENLYNVIVKGGKTGEDTLQGSLSKDFSWNPSMIGNGCALTFSGPGSSRNTREGK